MVDSSTNCAPPARSQTTSKRHRASSRIVTISTSFPVFQMAFRPMRSTRSRNVSQCSFIVFSTPFLHVRHERADVKHMRRSLLRRSGQRMACSKVTTSSSFGAPQEHVSWTLASTKTSATVSLQYALIAWRKCASSITRPLRSSIFGDG